jgi:pimeloyl-ACP methyl ester carboxylesterase
VTEPATGTNENNLPRTTPRRYTASLGDAEITVAQWGDGPAEIVLLHDGLGSIDQWRRIPSELARRTGCAVMAYDRPGHGTSTPVPDGPWPADWLHREADRFGRLLDAVEANEPLVVGHSDGGSIGLLHAVALAESQREAADHQPIRGLLTLAAHSWVEQRCFDAIAGMRARPQQIIIGLARNHADPEAVFEAWSGVWVSEDFRRWDIRPRLHTISCPTLVAQGTEDEYATDAHAIETASAIGDNASYRLLDGVGHLLHHQDPDLIVDVVSEFHRSLD